MRRSKVSLKKRLIIMLVCMGLWLLIVGPVYYRAVSRALDLYNAAKESEACCPPSVPAVESERLIAFREESKRSEWQTFGIEEYAWGDVIGDLGFTPDVEGTAQFLAVRLSPFNYLSLRAMLPSIIATEVRKGKYQCSDDGLFHLNADGSVGLLFLSDSVANYEAVHYFRNTDEGVKMGMLVRLPEEKRKEIAATLDIIPKPEI